MVGAVKPASYRSFNRLLATMQAAARRNDHSTLPPVWIVTILGSSNANVSSVSNSSMLDDNPPIDKVSEVHQTPK